MSKLNLACWCAAVSNAEGSYQVAVLFRAKPRAMLRRVCQLINCISSWDLYPGPVEYCISSEFKKLLLCDTCLFERGLSQETEHQKTCDDGESSCVPRLGHKVQPDGQADRQWSMKF